MAQHDGSFLSTLPMDDSASAEETNESLGKVSESLQMLTEVTDRFQIFKPVNGSQSCEDNVSKRPCQVDDKWSANDYHSISKQQKLKPMCTITSPPLDEAELSDLGILGCLTSGDDPDEEALHIFPTPSPQEFNRQFKINRIINANKQQFRQVTKKRAITIFDSPEDSKRGWSELGLRIRRRTEDTCALGQGYFNFIADEIILYIFKMMPKHILVKCSRVCKRWKRLSYDESLWKRLNLSRRVLPPSALGNCVLNRGTEILNLCGAEISSPIYSRRLLRLCKLQYLDLTMATVSIKTLRELFSHCKYLKKLSLESVMIDDNICSSIAKNSMLTTLNLAMAQGFTANGLNAILKQCTLIGELNISWTKLSPDDVRSTILNLPKTLLRLNFSGCRQNLTDDDVYLLVSSCPSLVELDLSDSLRLTENCVGFIQTGLANLEMLHLSRCYYIIPEALVCLRNMPRLKSLNVYSMMQEENLAALTKSLGGTMVNSNLFSTVARPTVSPCRTSIWGLRVRDIPV